MWVLVLPVLATTATASDGAAPPATVRPRTPVVAPEPSEATDLVQVPIGRSVVLTLPVPPLAVAVTDPTVATVHALGTPTVLQLQGHALGSTDLVVSFVGGHVRILDVEVARDVSQLVRVIERLVEGEPPRVSAPVP